MGHRRDWQKTDPDLRIHPRFKTLCLELGAKPYAVDGWLSGIWRTAFSQAEDGDLTRFGLAGIVAMAEYDGALERAEFVQALIDQNFIEGEVGEDDAGNPVVKSASIHGWEEWGGALFAERNRWARKKAEGRAQKSEGQPETKGEVAENRRDPRERERLRERKSLNTLREFKPDFPAWWDTYGKAGSRAKAEEVYLHWRQQGASREDLLTAARNYRAHCASVGRIMKDGSTFLAKRVNIWEEWVKPEATPAAAPHDPTTEDRTITCLSCGAEVGPEEMVDAIWLEGKGWLHRACAQDAP